MSYMPKIKNYTTDETKSWEERYKELDAHHVAETTLLLEKIRDLEATVESLSAELEEVNDEFDDYRWDNENV